MKKVFALFISVILIASIFTACGKKEDEDLIYYLNFKPESEQIWQEIAKVYEDETGDKVKVVTAASGTYEST